MQKNHSNVKNNNEQQAVYNLLILFCGTVAYKCSQSTRPRSRFTISPCFHLIDLIVELTVILSLILSIEYYLEFPVFVTKCMFDLIKVMVFLLQKFTGLSIIAVTFAVLSRRVEIICSCKA